LLPYCTKCGAEVAEGVKFCTKCGAAIGVEVASSTGSDIIAVTSQTVPGFRVKKVLGLVTGLTARTRGIGGKFIAGIESMIGGEVTAFTYEIEKARVEALDRMKSKARELGANAVIAIDMETSDVFEATMLISATGTAVVVEPE
jgi:uncharacterized protein YbjQ (UPF0145 family)